MMREQSREVSGVDDDSAAPTGTSGRLAHVARCFDPRDVSGAVTGTRVPSRSPGAGARPPSRRPTLALTAEGPRRADLLAWASAHRDTLSTLRLLAPAAIGTLLRDRVGVITEPLRAGTVGPAASAGLVAAGDIDAMVAFTDPIELSPGDTTTRSMLRLAVFWDIPVAANRSTADLLLGQLAVELPARTEPAAEVPPPVRATVRLWNVRATVDDVPGRLAILAASMARRAINILSVQVHMTDAGSVDELLVAASPVVTAGDLAAAVLDGGGRSPQVGPADAHVLVDAPTRALTLATRLIRGPRDVRPVLASLYPGARLEWMAEAPYGHDDDPCLLWLTDPTGGGFLVRRPRTPFTPAERARGYAMMDVATVALARAAVRDDSAP
jgi:methylglyoxal synthase